MSRMDKGQEPQIQPEEIIDPGELVKPKSRVDATGREFKRVASFVERETQRQKRMLGFYLSLLMIPVLLGVAVLIFGRSDRRVVTDEIKQQAPTIVRGEIQEQVRPAIQNEVQTQVSSSLRVIGELKARQESLTNEVNQIKTSDARLTAEEIQMIKRSSALLLQREAEIKRLYERVENLEGQIKAQNPNTRPGQIRDRAKEVLTP